MENNKKSRIHIDLLLCKDNIPIELKYRTKKAEGKSCFEDNIQYIFKLTNQGARDEGCYGFWRDVCRVQEFKNYNKKDSTRGFVIFLTNDEWYRNTEPVSELDEKYYKNRKADYRMFILNEEKWDCRGGRISGHGKALYNIPKIKKDWLEWTVKFQDGTKSMKYWCYIAEV